MLNLGSAGSAIDATNNGLVLVEGPAVWIPNPTTNDLNTVSPWTGTDAFPDDVEILVEGVSMDWAGAIPSSHHFLAFGSTGPFRVTYFGESFYISLTTGAGAFPNSIIFSDNDIESSGVTDEFLDLRWRYTSATGYVTMDWRISGSESWNSITPGTNNPRVGPLVAVAGTISWQQTSWPCVLSGSVQYRNGFDGPAVFAVTSQDIAHAAPDATSFVCSTGQVINVNRATTGPVTTIVPGGAAYINPTAIAGTYMALPDSADWDVALGEDAVLAWCGGVSNDSTAGDFRRLIGQATDAFEQFTWGNTNNNVFGVYRDTPGLQIAPSVGGLALNKRYCFISVLDRTAQTITIRAFDEEGQVGQASLSAASLVALAPTGSSQMLVELPGAVNAAAWHKGVGIAANFDATACEDLARLLLATARRTAATHRGPYPPAGNKLEGDRWFADNGHSAIFDGTEWVALDPLTDNICVLLGNAELLLVAGHE